MSESLPTSPESEKTITLLLLGTVLVSLLVLVPTIFRYSELTKQYDNQAQELENVNITILNLENTIEELNKTLSILSTAPSMRAAEIIIERVGLEYFNAYYHDPVVTFSPRLNDTIVVTYLYDTEIGNNSQQHEVNFYFGNNWTHYFGLPVEENLQPFNVTFDDAKELAIQGGLPVSQYPLDGRFIYEWIEDVYPAKGFGEKYLWYIESWDDPTWANPRKRHSAKIDPITGQVYSINPGGSIAHEYEVDTPEKALEYGVDGYIKLNYSELPQRILLTGGQNFTFSILVDFISYSDDMVEATLHIDPDYNETYWIHGRFADKLRSYLTYEPSGVFSLTPGEIVNVTCTLSIPLSEIELEFNRYSLHALGIEGEGVLVVHDLDT